MLANNRSGSQEFKANIEKIMAQVLIIEDSKSLASLLVRELAAKDIIAETASDLASAEELLEAQDSDFFACLVDLNLPDAPDGEAIDLVVAGGIPAVVYTSTISHTLRSRLFRKGVTDYVLKDAQDSVLQIVTLFERLQRNQTTHVLVVDDSDTQRKITARHLKHYRFRVTVAKTADEALKALTAYPDIKLVVTDFEMPETSGLELCREIRKTRSKNELAIIGVSSSEDRLLPVWFIKNGANDFLPKPFSREELYTRSVQNLEMLENIRAVNDLNLRMKRDLDAAAKLQRGLLPSEPPEIPGIHFAMSFLPCDELAGDCFDIIPLDDTHVGLYVVDVSGHGVRSALLSVTLTRLLRPSEDNSSLLLDDTGFLSPSAVCELLNRRFPMDTESLLYFTILYGIVNTETGEFSYCSAGHPSPLLIRKQKAPSTSPPDNPPIGFIPNTDYRQNSLQLKPGDRLYFYTDGVTENRRKDGEEYGSQRLGLFLKALAKSELSDTLTQLMKALDKWNGGRFRDDVTVCAFEYSGINTPD